MSIVILFFFSDLLRQSKQSIGLLYCPEFIYSSDGIDSFFESEFSLLWPAFSKKSDNIRMIWSANSENFKAFLMILLILKCILMIGDNKWSAYSEILLILNLFISDYYSM